MATRRLPLRKRRRPSSWSLGKCLLVGTLCGMLSMITYGLLRFPLRSSISAPVPPEPSTAETTISVLGSETKPTTDCRPLDSHADITTKGLYDSILFNDIDGGVWKQGWEVKYKGDEWNQEKLKVFVVPHSHNDPGWLRTVEEYYKERTVHIFASIIRALDQDPRRKFIWEEISYLQRWWQDASLEDKALFSKFVKNGQLEIVGGGWVMNDEANSHFYAITEQITEGNVWLWDTFGVRPKNAWAIDPFGHSSTMAYLLRRMGFENMLIQRVHYEVKKALARSTSLEFFWRQSWDRTNATDIFCHMMPFYSYDVPHTCGPEPAVCCQFDFARLPSAPTGYSCPWNIPPQEITLSNVKERAELILDQYRKKSTLYRTNTVLIPLGDDFRYTSSTEADLQFRNYEAIFEYINSHPGLHAQIQWGTLEDYFSTLRKEVGRRSTSMQSHFPTLSGDFFTYADRVKDYWSGYYVSRPFFKAVDRVLEETLRAAEILFSLDLAYGRSGGLLSQQFASPLVRARRNLALFQHHDGITGTARDHVVVDYGTRMHSSLADLQALMAAAAEALLRPPSSPPPPNNPPPPSSLKMLEPEQTRSRHDVLPEHTPLSVSRGGARRVVVYNPIAHRVERTTYVALPGAVAAGVCVLDSALNPVASQLSPDWAPHSGGRTTGRQRLYWVARVPPLGLETYFVVSPVDHKGCTPAKRAVVEAYNAPKGWKPPGGGYTASTKDSGTEPVVSIGNRRHRLAFDAGTGLLKSVGCPWGRHVDVAEEFALYSSIESGAYLFMPLGPAAPIVRTGGLVLVSRGELVQEVMTEPAVGEDLGAGGSPIVRWARLYTEEGVQGSVVEMQHHVNLERRSDLDNKELVVRYRTGLESGNVFYSDLNGFQTMRRERYSKIPTQGNFYPMPAHAFLEDAAKGVRFTVHTRQAVGVASLDSGWLEMMLDRRLLQDDHRGLEQGVTDNHPTDVVFHLLLEISSPPRKTPSSSSSPLHLSLLSNLVSSHLAHPFHTFLGPPQSGEIKLPSTSGDALSTRFAPLGSDEGLPCDLHVLNLKTIRPEGGLGVEGVLDSKPAGTALLLQRHGLDCTFGWSGCSASGGKGFTVDSLFRDLVASDVVSTSLNLVHDGEEAEHLESVVAGHGKNLGRGGLQQDGGVGMMEEMEVRALKFNLGVRRSSSKL